MTRPARPEPPRSEPTYKVERDAPPYRVMPWWGPWERRGIERRETTYDAYPVADTAKVIERLPQRPPQRLRLLVTMNGRSSRVVLPDLDAMDLTRASSQTAVALAVLLAIADLRGQP